MVCYGIKHVHDRITRTTFQKEMKKQGKKAD